MLNDISLRDLIDSKGFEASLITTYNASLPFYEEVIERRLRANGCRHNVVLMDSAQCATSWESEATRPKRAGFDYALVPVRSAGAFHPKVAIFVGPKKLALLVGSHNLTVAGFGFNREISNLLEIQGKKHEHGELLAGVWEAVSQWLERARSHCPPEVIQNALRLQDRIRPFLNQSDVATRTRFLYQSSQTASLFDQMRRQVTFPVRRIMVAGAFFDGQLGFLKALRQQWSGADIVVGIDPMTVVLPSSMHESNLRFVDARAIWQAEEQKYLHAKILYLEGDGDHAVFLSGSANPSTPGWGVSSGVRNDEAMMLLEGAAARTALEQIRLHLLFALDAIQPSVLDLAVVRGKSVANSEATSAPAVYVGTVDPGERTISVELSATAGNMSMKLLDGLDQEIEVTSTISVVRTTVTVRVSERLNDVRSMLLLTDQGAFARVLVHHTQNVDATSSSSRHHIIRLALGEIGSSEEDIAAYVEQVQQVIFADDVSAHIRSRHGTSSAIQSGQSQRPNSLAVEDHQFGRRKKRRRLIESGDLGYMVDTLIRLLHTPSEASNHVSEPVLLEDEGSDDAEDPPLEVSLDDAAIAAAIVSKSRTLVRKMIQREEIAASDKDQAATMLVQLVAVLAVLKELRHVERQGRWKTSSLQLVDSHALQSLLQKSMFYLFSSKHRLWSVVEEDGREHYEELDTLNLLLTWLTWEVGYSFKPIIPSRWDATEEQRIWNLTGNGYLAKLLPRVGVEDQWKLLETSVQRSIPVTPKEKKTADGWIVSHTIIGEALLDEFTREPTQGANLDTIGGFAHVPGLVAPWSVVLEADDKKVALWDFEFQDGQMKKRIFMRPVVIPATSISNAYK